MNRAHATAGALGYLWAVGRRGGRDLVVRNGRWLHLAPQRLQRAEPSTGIEGG